MTNFVLAYAAPMIAGFSDVLLPDSRMLPGGAITTDEMPEVAAARYLKEFGLDASLPDIRIMGVMQHVVGGLVYACHCPVRGDKFHWTPLEEVMRRDSKVPPSIKLVCALCRAGLINWSFINNGPIIGLNLEGCK